MFDFDKQCLIVWPGYTFISAAPCLYIKVYHLINIKRCNYLLYFARNLNVFSYFDRVMAVLDPLKVIITNFPEEVQCSFSALYPCLCN